MVSAAFFLLYCLIEELVNGIWLNLFVYIVLSKQFPNDICDGFHHRCCNTSSAGIG